MGKNRNTRIHSLMKLLAMMLGSKLYKLLIRGSSALAGASETPGIEKDKIGTGTPTAIITSKLLLIYVYLVFTICQELCQSQRTGYCFHFLDKEPKAYKVCVTCFQIQGLGRGEIKILLFESIQKQSIFKFNKYTWRPTMGEVLGIQL